MKIISIGEVLWDVFEASEKLGGAPLNFAVHASRLGHDVTFISAVGDDERGRAALQCVDELGLKTDFIKTIAGAETGTATVRVDSAGQPDFEINRPAAYDCLRLDTDPLRQLAAMKPDWLYFGTLHQAVQSSRSETLKLAQSLPCVKTFYDVNLRPRSYTRGLVADLASVAKVVKLNEQEAVELDSMFGCRHRSLAEFTGCWLRKFGWEAMAVTCGFAGCAVRIGGDFAEVPGYAVTVADTVGAGDAFAAAFLHGLSQGWDAGRTGDFANRVGAIVASRCGAVPDWSAEDCSNLTQISA